MTLGRNVEQEGLICHVKERLLELSSLAFKFNFLPAL